MSHKKILFFIVSIVVVISLIIIINTVNTNQSGGKAPKSLTIWINEGTTDAYTDIINGFKKFAPEYAKTNIVIEKKTSDANQYRTLLLNTIANGGSPDIFQLKQGEDIVLERQVEAIPSNVIDFTDFEKRYGDLFLPLLFSTGTKMDTKEYLMGVPLGFETLGIFYNKSILSTAPKTWNELDTLYHDGVEGNKFPSNLGLGPRYTPNIAEILAILFGNNKITTYEEIGGNDGVFSSYLYYGTTPPGGKYQNTDDTYTKQGTLAENTTEMDTAKLTTLDMFVRGEIGMIIGFPGIITDLEKAYKRAGIYATNDTILTDMMLQDSPSGKRRNLGKYSYFAISKSTSKGIAAAKFLEYLMSEEAEQKYIKSFPHMIPAQIGFYNSVKNTKISDVFPHAKLDVFIPKGNDSIFSFNYGLRTEFDTFLDKYLDRNNIGNINNISSLLSTSVRCAVAPYTDGDIPSNCENKN